MVQRVLKGGFLWVMTYAVQPARNNILSKLKSVTIQYQTESAAIRTTTSVQLTWFVARLIVYGYVRQIPDR
jgi:hypothetical protein